MTADWMIPDPYNSQSFNRYSYVNNNPVNFVDPSGNVVVYLDPIVVTGPRPEPEIPLTQMEYVERSAVQQLISPSQVIPMGQVGINSGMINSEMYYSQMNANAASAGIESYRSGVWWNAFQDRFYQETYTRTVRPVEVFAGRQSQNIREWSEGVNWKTVGIGGAQIYAGGSMIGQALAIEALTGGVGTSVSAWQASVGVMSVSSGFINVIIGLTGEETYEAHVVGAVRRNPVGQGTTHFLDMF